MPERRKGNHRPRSRFSDLVEYLKGEQTGAFPGDPVADSTVSRLAAMFGIGGSLLSVLVFLGGGIFPVAAISAAGVLAFSGSLVLDYFGWNRISRLWTGTAFLIVASSITYLVSTGSGFNLFILTGLPMSQVLFGRNERPLKILAISVCVVLFIPSAFGWCELPRLPIDHYWLRVSSLFAALLIFTGFSIILNRFAALLRTAEAEQREMATTDELTGLSNRRHVLEQADDMVKVAARYGRNLSVIIMDVDHFKQINDVHGHLAGDQVLRDISATIRRCIRKADIVGRYGGEEFVIVLPETAVEQAAVVADHVRTEVAAMSFEFNGASASVSLSAGISAFCPKEGVDFNKILSRADDALYAAKADGRNCVKMWKYLGANDGPPCPPVG